MKVTRESKLKDMDLSIRTINCLNAAEIYTVGDLLVVGVDNLLKFRHFGKRSAQELKEFLAENRNIL